MLPPMPMEMAILLVTAAIAAMGVIVYLWTAGASLLMAVEIHLLRVETHQLRIDYARRIAALAGGDESNVDIVDDGQDGESEGAAEPIASIGAEAEPMKAAA